MAKQTPESRATGFCIVAASQRGCILFRNNSGGFYDDSGRFISFGLGNDGTKVSKTYAFGDYVGITPVTITPEMVGKTIGVFTNLEFKPDGATEKTIAKAKKHPQSREGKQLRAIEIVRENHGIAWFASNPDEINQIIDFHIAEFKK